MLCLFILSGCSLYFDVRKRGTKSKKSGRYLEIIEHRVRVKVLEHFIRS